MGGLLIFALSAAGIFLGLYVAATHIEKLSALLFPQLWRVADLRVKKRKTQQLMVEDMRARASITPVIVEPVKKCEPPPKAPVIEGVVVKPQSQKPEKKEDVKPEMTAQDYVEAIALLGVLADCGKNDARKAWAARNKTATGPGGSPEMVKGLADAFETIFEFRKWKQ